jgi:hypothetical protein
MQPTVAGSQVYICARNSAHKHVCVHIVVCPLVSVERERESVCVCVCVRARACARV